MTTANNAQIKVGQKVFSAVQGDHGCREGWIAEVMIVDGDAVTATITSNTHCFSCWQTGCVDNGRKDNDRVGEVVGFNVADCHVDDYDQIIVGLWQTAPALGQKNNRSYLCLGRCGRYAFWRSGYCKECQPKGELTHGVLHADGRRYGYPFGRTSNNSETHGKFLWEWSYAGSDGEDGDYYRLELHDPEGGLPIASCYDWDIDGDLGNRLIELQPQVAPPSDFDGDGRLFAEWAIAQIS